MAAHNFIQFLSAIPARRSGSMAAPRVSTRSSNNDAHPSAVPSDILNGRSEATAQNLTVSAVDYSEAEK